MNTLISIITPTYNRGYIIWKTIHHIIRQKYKNWELLIVDDGSTDNTKQVIAQFQEDNRIKYIQLPHKGSQFARNEGLKVSSGKLITYVDSDDFLYNNYLSTAFDYFQAHPTKIFATCNYIRKLELYDDNYKLIESFNSPVSKNKEISIMDFYKWEVKTCGTGIFHRDTIKSKNITWDVKIKRFQDWDFILQLARFYENGYMFIPTMLFEYHQRYGIDGICSDATYGDWAEGFRKIYKKYKDDPLMKNQTWYPKKVSKYLRLQRLSDKQIISPIIYQRLKFITESE